MVTTVAMLASPVPVAADTGSHGPGLGEPPAVASVGALAAADDPVGTDTTTDEANPFLPDERDLTDCVGLVERPGCGSESRGGLHQNLVAIAMVGGLLIVFGRIAWSVRRGQQRQESSRVP